MQQHTRHMLGFGTVVLVSVVPLILWSTMLPLEVRFGSAGATLQSLGQLTALLGLSMFSVSLILMARIGPVERLFGGLDHIFTAHRHLGIVGFLLMLVHPLLLAVRLVPVSVADAALFLLPSFEDAARTLGIVALALMMGIIGVTLYAHWRYQVLLATHRVLGLAFMLGVLHAFMIPSDLSGNPFLTAYCGVLAFGGIAAYLYRTVFKRAVPKYAYTVETVKKLGAGLTEVTLAPVDTPLRYTAGQFAFLSFSDPHLSAEAHPFTIASGPDEGVLRFTIKALGDWTADAALLTLGSGVLVEGPYGGFTAARARTDQELWIAGGVGITPFLSRARALAARGHVAHDVTLYYCVSTRGELIFESEFKDIASLVPGFRVVPYVSAERGMLTAAVLAHESGPLHDRDIFVCGPAAMMKSIVRQCKEARVPSSQIHTEAFVLL